jgi:hypothetical protein
MQILIKAVGFIGDNLFGSSVITKLKQQYPGCKVDYLLTLPQPYELMKLNPNIDNVLLNISDDSIYDIIYQLKPINRITTPCEQFQQQCNIPNPTPHYTIYTNKSLDSYIEQILQPYKQHKKIIAWLSNWEERSFLYTEDQYKEGIDVPNLGYGGKHRDIHQIIKKLENDDGILLIEVGKPNGYNQKQWELGSVSEYSLTASILKNCHYFIGAEGGLANLASGVGTKTILTGDFVHQLYGWNGVIEKCEEPKLGPKYYFDKENHVVLNPYLTDKEVVEYIIKIIK